MTHRIGLMTAQWAPIRASLRCCRAYSPILHATAFVRPKLVRNAAAVLRYERRSLSSARKPNTQAPVGSQQAVPASKAVRSIGPKFVYPERLAIYHIGTGRTVFLGWLKIVTIFAFAFFGLVITPASLVADQPLWAAAYFAGGLVPFFFVAYTTSPVVTFITVSLPPFARTSRDMLLRFAKAPPPTTRLDLSTLSLIGKPRVSTTTLGDLRPTHRRFGLVNLERDTAAEDARRRWWEFRAVKGFHVQDGMERRLKGGWVWKEMSASATSKTKPKKA